MSQFILTYQGGEEPETPEEGHSAMENRKALAADLGPALINPDAPVGYQGIKQRGSVRRSLPHPLMGFSIFEADSMDAALELLKHCPHFDYADTLEGSEMMQMPE